MTIFAKKKKTILDVSQGSGYIKNNKQQVDDANKDTGTSNKKWINLTEICYIL